MPDLEAAAACARPRLHANDIVFLSSNVRAMFVVRIAR